MRPPRLLCRSSYRFNVWCFNFWWFLRILYQHCSLLWIRCCLFLWFLWYRSIWFNMNILCSGLLNLLWSALTCSIWNYPIRSCFSNLLFSILFDPIATILFICSDMIHSDLITMIWSDLILYGSLQYYPSQYNILSYLWSSHSPLLWSSPLYFPHSNPIQCSWFLFPALLCSLHSSSQNFWFCFK